MNLTEAQGAALDHIQAYAEDRKAQAWDTISHVLEMSNINREQYDEALSAIHTRARVAVQFHPDRLDPELKTVAEALLAQGMYKSQFETKLSSGSFTAYAGGARDRWEQVLFGGAYQKAGVRDQDRPKYGALDLMLHADGPSPRFGSCYFLLKPSVSHRCSFSYLDSHLNPPERGTYRAFDDIMAALLLDAFVRESVLGKHNIRPPRLMEHLCSDLEKACVDPASKMPSRNLDSYIEAQIHGDIRLKEDVEVLVADPSFQGTEIGDYFFQIAQQYDIDLHWHQGFVLSVDEVPMDFRGAAMPTLAERISEDDLISAYLIGKAAKELNQNPEAWTSCGTYKESRQKLKLMWHVLLKYGKPLSN